MANGFGAKLTKWTEETDFGQITWNNNTMEFIEDHNGWKHYSIEGTGADGESYKGTACVLYGEIEEVINIEIA